MLTKLITDLKDTKYLDTIFNHISDMVFLMSVDDNGLFTYVTANHAAIDKLQLPDQFRGCEISDLMPNSSAEIITEKYKEAAIKKETITYQTKIELPSASETRYCYVESKVTPILNKKGDCEQILAVTRDMTAWVEQEKQLKQAQEQLELMFNHVADAVFMFDHRADFTKMNPGFSELLGWTEEELLQDGNISILPPTDNDFPVVLAQLKQGQIIQNHRSKRMTKNNQMIDVLASYSPIMEEGQMVGGVAMYKDITEIKRMEDRLKESEERYRVIADHTNDLIRVLDLNGEVQYASPSHERLLGLSPEFYIGKSVLSFADPDDMEKIQDGIGHIIETKEPADIEYRLLHKSGDSIWADAQGTPVLNAEGDVEKIVMVIRDVSDRISREEQLRTLAMHDQLTELPNRRFFQQTLHQSIEDSKRTNKQIALLTMDCDNFKTVNDSYGHNAGDEIIKALANRIKGSIKNSDIVSRMGGDEFQALITGLDHTNDIIPIAERILKSMDKPFKVDGHTLSLTTSIGITFYNEEKGMEQLFKESDDALYDAKAHGKNTFSIYSPDNTSNSKWQGVKRLITRGRK